ncbi:MAG: thiamine pyrophosphate-dependent dehydrogenase E1 component subunit alpha [Kiritimatiellia bacterium]
MNGADRIRLYKTMLLIRCFETKINSLFSKGLVYGTTHLCIGQEASAAATGLALRKGDYVVGNHRSHGHALAKGLEPQGLMSEMLGRVSGYCRGLGGSQHVASSEHRLLGTNGITCGGMPTALGAAFAQKFKGSDDICAVYIGDGATNQGVFHETMNMAALWSVPLLVVCENNLYAMSTPLSSHAATGSDGLRKRGEAYGIKTVVVEDGLDAGAVYEAAVEAVDYTRSRCRPHFLIINTYRTFGHSKSDARVYRTREEEAAFKKKDSLKSLAEELVAGGDADATELKSWKSEIKARIDAVVDSALAEKSLSAEELFEHAEQAGYICEGNGGRQ